MKKYSIFLSVFFASYFPSPITQSLKAVESSNTVYPNWNMVSLQALDSTASVKGVQSRHDSLSLKEKGCIIEKLSKINRNLQYDDNQKLTDVSLTDVKKILEKNIQSFISSRNPKLFEKFFIFILEYSLLIKDDSETAEDERKKLVEEKIGVLEGGESAVLQRFLDDIKNVGPEFVINCIVPAWRVCPKEHRRQQGASRCQRCVDSDSLRLPSGVHDMNYVLELFRKFVPQLMRLGKTDLAAYLYKRVRNYVEKDAHKLKLIKILFEKPSFEYPNEKKLIQDLAGAPYNITQDEKDAIFHHKIAQLYTSDAFYLNDNLNIVLYMLSDPTTRPSRKKIQEIANNKSNFATYRNILKERLTNSREDEEFLSQFRGRFDHIRYFLRLMDKYGSVNDVYNVYKNLATTDQKNPIFSYIFKNLVRGKTQLHQIQPHQDSSGIQRFILPLLREDEPFVTSMVVHSYNRHSAVGCAALLPRLLVKDFKLFPFPVGVIHEIMQFTCPFLVYYNKMSEIDHKEFIELREELRRLREKWMEAAKRLKLEEENALKHGDAGKKDVDQIDTTENKRNPNKESNNAGQLNSVSTTYTDNDNISSNIVINASKVDTTQIGAQKSNDPEEVLADSRNLMSDSTAYSNATAIDSNPYSSNIIASTDEVQIDTIQIDTTQNIKESEEESKGDSDLKRLAGEIFDHHDNPKSEQKRRKTDESVQK